MITAGLKAAADAGRAGRVEDGVILTGDVEPAAGGFFNARNPAGRERVFGTEAQLHAAAAADGHGGAVIARVTRVYVYTVEREHGLRAGGGVDRDRVLRRFRRLLGYHGSLVYGGFAVLHDGLPGGGAVDAYAAERKIIAVGIRRRGSKQDNCRGTERGEA